MRMAEAATTRCPHCGTRNKTPDSTTNGDHPHCRQCHKRLFPDRALAMDEDALRQFLRHDQIPLLIDFWAPGCRPCKMLMPLLDQVARKHATSLRVIKINAAEYPATIKRHRIRAVPTLLLVRGGKELDRIAGSVDAARLDRWINQTL